MKQIPMLLCACWAATGCTSAIVQPGPATKTMAVGSQPSALASLAPAAQPSTVRSRNHDDAVVWVVDEPPATDEAIVTDGTPFADEAASGEKVVSEPALRDEPPSSSTPASLIKGPPVPQPGEEIPTPRPATEPLIVPSVEEDDHDRFARQLRDVPLDISPPQGPLPPNLAPEEMAEQLGRRESYAADQRGPIVCSFNPWTICYRPLYFEDIPLERYGRTYGIVQPAVSAAKFFCTVPILPYKMVVRPPRSCECSNGFSRPGDQPLPGYGARQVRLDAAVVEAAVITAIVLALP